jgi:hypothetical protein
MGIFKIHHRQGSLMDAMRSKQGKFPWRAGFVALLLLFLLGIPAGPLLAGAESKAKAESKKTLNKKTKRSVKATKTKEATPAPAVKKAPAERKASEGDLKAEARTSYRIYVTRKGDTLHEIAKKPEWYNNPLKWTLIYMLNAEELKQLPIPPEDVPSWPLEENMALAIMMPEQRPAGKDALRKWIINLMSSTSSEDLVPLAVRLLDNGHFTYITESTIKETSWKRLRVGFFQDEVSARAEAKHVCSDAGSDAFWITEATAQELQDYFGFF